MDVKLLLTKIVKSYCKKSREKNRQKWKETIKKGKVNKRMVK